MAVDLVVPQMGDSIHEGVVLRWLKQTGDYVFQNDEVVELETEKASQLIPAQTNGQLKVVVPVGKKVLVGAVLGTIDESVPAPPKAVGTESKSSAPVASPPTANIASTGPALSPAARVLAAQRNIDPASLTASGRGKVVTKDDVLAHNEKGLSINGTAAAAASKPAVERQPMTALRRRIAERLLASQQQTATLTTFNEVDMTAVMELRSKYKERFEKKHGVGLGFMSFFVKACVEAVRVFPIVNARIDGEEIVFHHHCDIGVAVSTEKGLLVPVVRRCETLTFSQIEKAILGLAVRARDGKLKPDDLIGGTFTITNGGVFGSMMSTPIINPPQSAILGMHSIQKRPVAINDQVVVRPMMYLALSYDHRLIDGREAVQFLVRVKECVENPERLLLEV